MGILSKDSTTDPNKILPIRYPWAREHYKMGVNNNWNPDDIPMQNDVEQWKSDALSSDERRLILWNLGFFSTAESLTANNIVLAVYKHVTDPACRQYMLRQAFEEAIHSETFIYCCDSLGLDPEEIYTMYQTIPTIKEKDDFVVDLTKTIFDPHFVIRTDDDVRLFLRDLIGYYVIMEGIFFYAGFAMMLAMKRQKKMIGVGEQFDYILRDECLAGDSELLTKSGWKNIKEITTSTEVAQYHSDGSIDFACPTRLSRSLVDHVYEFKNEQGHVNQLVSENHRFVYRTITNQLKVLPAKDVSLHPYSSVINCGNLKGGGKQFLTARERFLIALQADGTIPDTDLRDGSTCGYRTYIFYFFKERKIKRLVAILEELGWNYTLTKSNTKDGVYFRVQVPLDLPVDKHFRSWVSLEGAMANWCREFIQEVAEWDGHWVKDSKKRRVTYGSVVESNVDIVQAIAVLCDCRTQKTVRPDDRSETFNDYYRLQINLDRQVTNGQCMKKSVVPYNDFVYGVEVPSSYLLMRRNGGVSVTGNSIHLAFGCDLIGTIRTEHPAAWTDCFGREITSLVQRAVELECQYANDACPRGLLGINAEQFGNYVKYMADRRLERLGLDKIYDIENPFPWMSQSTDLSKEKNFFETRVTEYKSGGLVWDD